MRKRRIWLNAVFVLIVIMCLASITVILRPSRSYELIIAVISLDVALLALYISLRTFFSIDEVNAISRMDGNVMENPRYRPNMLRAVFLFPQTGFADTSKALMNHIEGLFRDNNKQSGAHLADNVQEIANLLVLVPYFINTKNQEESAVQLERIITLLESINHRVNNFKEISDGSCKLLEETVNLIDSVFAYQSMNSKRKSDPSKLLEIRGSIFINPVTRILYNDYLGLYFLKRAKSLLSGHQRNCSLRQLVKLIEKCSDDEKSLALVYLGKASESFKLAKENIGDDMIWTGYICFNIGRSEYLKEMINKSFGVKTNDSNSTYDRNWESYINESIRSWMTTNKIIAEHFNNKLEDKNVTWLQQAFVSEENNVRLSKIILQMMRKEPLTDYNGNLWVQHYGDITKTQFYKDIPNEDPLKLTDILIEDVNALLLK